MSTASTFYDMTTRLKDILLSDDNVSTVTYGDIHNVATQKTTIYPLSHFIVNDVTVNDQTFLFNISLSCMDIIDYTNEKTSDHFNGSDNMMDIFNTQMAVVSRATMLLKRANMRNEGFQLVGEPTMSQFKHRFEDDVAGWDVTFDVQVIQDMNVC
jgi:hypothetical protein